MTTLLADLSNQVQDELPQIVHEAFMGIDPVYEEIDQTSIGVVTSNSANMGYKWQVNHLFNSGLAGLFEQGAPEGPDILTRYDYTSTKFIDSSSSATTPFPTATDSPHAGVIKRTLALHMNTGNFSVPVVWLQHDKLSAAHVKQVAMDIQALGQLRALYEAISFFCHNVSGKHVLAQINGTFTDVGTYSTQFAVDNGRIQYFRPGMMVDVVADSSGTPQHGDATDGTDVRNYDENANKIRVMVSAVDYLNKKITLSPVNSAIDLDPDTSGGESGLNASLADNDWIVMENAGTAARAYWPFVTWGLNDWLKSSGYLFQTGAAAGFNLSTYPHFASSVTAVGGVLTEDRLNDTVGAFIDAYGVAAPDTIITTWGVTTTFLDQPTAGDARMNFDRTGKALDVNSGFAKVKYTFNGRVMNWIISSMCLPGYLYALKLGGGNVKRYVPPALGGAKEDRIGREVEFLAPAGGHSGVFKIAHASTGASMAVLEAPFWQYRLIAPVDVRGVVLTGLTES
jgi:hypothetical protein